MQKQIVQMPIEGLVKPKLHFFEGKRPDSQWVVIAYDSRSEYLLGCGPEIIFVHMLNKFIFIKISIIIPVYKLVI
jgi:hypothetical protein